MRNEGQATAAWAGVAVGAVRCASLAAPRAAGQVPPSAAGTRVVDGRALGDEANGHDWLAFGRTYSEQRFSPLTEVDTSTVARLAPAWVLELPNEHEHCPRGQRGHRRAADGRCGACHGPGAVSAGMAPDLRAASVVTSAAQFARIVRNGTRAARGMPAYADLTDQDLTALRHYIRAQAERALARKP